MQDLEQDLLTAIQVLNASVWRNRVDGATIEQWLREFGNDGLPGTRGRLHALYLLSRFMYFGDDEVRALLRALFRDRFKYPIIAEVRREAGDTRDEGVLRAAFELALSRTRFVGMGNPSESGTHLLYHYRQENELPSKLFISGHEVFDLTQNVPTLADPTVTRYVFIDDFCGSGEQAVRYSRKLLRRLVDAAAQAGVTPRIAYHVVVATRQGLQRVRNETKFNEVSCVLELDETFRAFDPSSRSFAARRTGLNAILLTRSPKCLVSSCRAALHLASRMAS